MDAGNPAGGSIRRLARRLRAEEGFALPTVALIMVAAFALVTVGVTATINTERGTVRDQQTKAALQLAETAVNQAVLGYNRLTPSITNPCSPVTSSTPDANRWCQGPVQQLNGGAYTYQVQVPQRDVQGRFVPGSDGNITLKVVGTGTMGNATRRVLVDADSLSNQPFSGEYQVRSAGDITLDGNATIRAGVATNGSVLLNNQSRVCGPTSVGIGQTITTGSGGYYTDSNCTQPGTDYGQQELNLPLLGPVPTTNDDGRLYSQDPVSGNKSNACFNGHDANVPPRTNTSCGARELDVKQNTSVTLGGSVYVLCKLSLNQNTSLTLAVNPNADPSAEPAKVRIYFDSPENCGYPSGTTQLDMQSNSRITSNGGGKADVELLFLGSTSNPPRQTIVSMASNTDQNAACEQNFIVYAPLSDVVIKGANTTAGSTYCGALAGRTVHVQSNVSLVSGRFDLAIQPPVPYYQPAEFVDCRAAVASAPNYDAGC